MRIVLKSKIHRAMITHVDLNYEGSIGIDAGLLREADIVPYEQAHVLDIANGARFETYVIEEPDGSGAIAIYGAAARLVALGDLLIIMSYQICTDDEARSHEPRVVIVGPDNRPLGGASSSAEP